MKTRPKALPTKVFSYGCTGGKGPLENEEAVWNQLFLANRYRNQLVEIELRRRADHKAILEEMDSGLSGLTSQITSLTEKIESLVAEKKVRNSAERKRQRHADIDSQISSLKADRRRVVSAYKVAKKVAYADPRYTSALKAADLSASAAIKEARKVASRDWGLFWGTYLTVEDSLKNIRKGTPPKFTRFQRRNGGCIAVQIQSGASKDRLTADGLCSAANQYVQLVVEDIPESAGKRRQSRPTALVRLCVGGKDQKRRISKSNPPQYVTLRITLHRPLPKELHITWARVVANPVGTKMQWSVQFVVATAGNEARQEVGEVGVDIGYRSIDDGRIRVAYAVGSDGQQYELTLPPDLVRALKHNEELQSLRDQKFDVVRASLLEWLKVSSIPEWLKDETTTLVHWRSIFRLSQLVHMWRTRRFDGDVGMYGHLEAWAKEDRHHLEWMANESQRACNRRDDTFRKWVYGLAGKYQTCVLEDIDLRTHAEADYLSKSVQKQRSIAAVSRLRQYIAERMQVVKVCAVNTTRTCHRYGQINVIGTDRTYSCAVCGWSGDRDLNAATNILRAVQCCENACDLSNEAA